MEHLEQPYDARALFPTKRSLQQETRIHPLVRISLRGGAAALLWLALSWNVIMVNASSEPLRKRRPLQARDVLFLTAVAVAFALLYAGRSLAPWLHFTGGSFHVLPWWSGAGSFAGPDGTYQLYLYLTPLDTRSHPTIRTALTGNGQLCTPSGERLVLHVSADMDKHLPWNTLGRSIDISSFARSTPGTFSAMTAPGSAYVRLSGVWGPGRIDAKGTLAHQPAAPGHPPPPRPAPITVTLQRASDWSMPSCPTHSR